MNVTVWGEGFLDVEALPEDERPVNYEDYVGKARQIYPQDVHEAVAAALRATLGYTATVRVTTLDDPDSGLGEAIVAETEVLVWWSHVKHHLVSDEIVERLWRRIVVDGMGLVVLHAGTGSKLFRRLMGTTCGVGRLRQSDDWEALWTMSAGHPIARDVPPVVLIPREEMYCEHFDIPTPDELVFVSTFRGGEVFRSGCCFERGRGRIFYFRPGHESHPTYHQPDVQRILGNAAAWAAGPREQMADVWRRGDESDRAAVAERLVPEGWFHETTGAAKP